MGSPCRTPCQTHGSHQVRCIPFLFQGYKSWRPDSPWSYWSLPHVPSQDQQHGYNHGHLYHPVYRNHCQTHPRKEACRLLPVLHMEAGCSGYPLDLLRSDHSYVHQLGWSNEAGSHSILDLQTGYLSGSALTYALSSHKGLYKRPLDIPLW